MKKILFVFGALLIGALLVHLVQQDPGYMLIGFGDTTIEMSLALGGFIFLMAGLLLLVTIKFIKGFFRVPKSIHRWQSKRSSASQRKALTRGLTELAEGHWVDAERTLIRYAKSSDTPLLNYLSAARAAQHQGADDRRDEYIRLAHNAMPSANIAVGLTHAELQLAHGQYEQALATLGLLKRDAPRHDYVLKTLAGLYEQVGDWERLRELLPEIEKRKLLDSEKTKELKMRMAKSLLSQYAQQKDSAQIRTLWHSLSKDLRQETDLVLHHAGCLNLLGEGREAEEEMRSAIRKNFSNELVYAYGLLESGDTAKHFSAAESWLKGNEQNPVLLLTLGRLAARNELWGKAKSYLETSLAIDERVETCKELAALLEKTGESAAAVAYYRQGLLLAKNDSPFPAVKGNELLALS